MFSLVKVTIKTHQGKIVFLSRYVLVSVVKVKLTLLNNTNEVLCILRPKVYQADRPVYKGILDKTHQRFNLVQSAQYYPDRVKGEVGNEETLRRCVGEESANLFRPCLVQKTLKPYIRVYQVHGSSTSPFKSLFLKF